MKRTVRVIAAILALILCAGCARAGQAHSSRLDGALAEPLGENLLPAETRRESGETTTAAEPAGEPTQPETAETSETERPSEGAAAAHTAAVVPATAEETTVKRAEPVIKTKTSGAGIGYTDSILTAGDEHWYKFTAWERGMLKVSISASSKQNLSSRVAEVYQVYYLNGVDGETGLRRIAVLNAFSANGESATPCIGVAPGEYRVKITSGDVTALSEYTMRLDFTARTDYEIECNDTPSRYSELVSGLQTRGSASFDPDVADRDWYLFRMYYDGALRLKFRHATGSLRTTAFKVALYNDRFEKLYAGTSSFDLGTLNSGTLGVKAGIYYVCVENRVYYDGDYGLTVTAEHGGGFEAEPNDTPESATALKADAALTGALIARDGAQDADCFAVTLKKPGLLRLALTTAGAEANEQDEDDEKAARYAFRVTLLSPAGETLYAALISDAQKEFNAAGIGLPAGRYTVRIDNAELYGTDADYTVSYAFTADSRTEAEPNGTPETANVLPFGGSITGAVLDGAHGYDADHYTFSVPREQTVTLTFTHGAKKQGEIYELALTDAQGRVKQTVYGADVVSVPGDAPKTVLTYTLAAGAYCLRVRAGLFSYDGAYTIALSEGS